jgi:hypothetical protein
MVTLQVRTADSAKDRSPISVPVFGIPASLAFGYVLVRLLCVKEGSDME